MRPIFLGLIYLMFFLSGAAALMYEVLWVRSLGLIFGGSHLAVTTVLSVFMAGLALGSYWIGRNIHRFQKPLRLYGFLEIGIGLFAIIFAALMRLYPSIYIFLAQGKDDSLFYLSFIRVAFAVAAMIVPTTLMGGTLPVLSSFVSKGPKDLGRHLSFLYGINTLGAVTGAMAAGFYFLRFYSVSKTLAISVATNLVIGLVCMLLQRKAGKILGVDGLDTATAPMAPVESPYRDLEEKIENLFPSKLVLWGIGISGFCALGYEVLWTRVLSIIVGPSVYGFTIMLVAFLMGIALGSALYGLFKIVPSKREAKKKFLGVSIVGFGVVQMIIGITAMLVTFHIRHLLANPTHIQLQNYFLEKGMGVFGARQWATFLVAFFYMTLPAFFMGLAFPLAGRIHAEYRKVIGPAVGEIFTYNTIGAILGAALSGFALIYLLGMERSLQILTVINIGFGLFVIFSVLNIRTLNWAILGLAVATLLFLTLYPNVWRMWDRRYFAIFRNNQVGAFRTPGLIREAVENTEVLYYQEGVEAIVSSIKVKGGEQAFIIDGKVEASSLMEGMQCQYTLGHLPMLLHKAPRKVLVIGLGSGMTLGATSVHPSTEEVTLVELEPKVIGVARTFEKYNHHVLENPKLKIIFNDGRNFLMTTKNKYDVITADPIHPWARGSSYLYTSEYFKIASEHLSPGGVMCQWLPIYELSTEDLRSVAKTFSEHFAYRMVWLTHNDAELIGSNSPIMINEEELEQRISDPGILSDLKRVMMASATDFLSYFVMGTEGVKAFSEGGMINTDDNLYLEFTSPFSVGESVLEGNIRAMTAHRESILPFLLPGKDEVAKKEQKGKWMVYQEAAAITDRAHAIFSSQRLSVSEFRGLMQKLDEEYPFFAPGKFLKNEYLTQASRKPRLLDKMAFILLDERGTKKVLEISAVEVRVSDELTSVVFVNNEARVIYGQLMVPGSDTEEFIRRFTRDVFMSLQKGYQKEARNALNQGNTFPMADHFINWIKNIIASKIQENTKS